MYVCMYHHFINGILTESLTVTKPTSIYQIIWKLLMFDILPQIQSNPWYVAQFAKESE